MDEVDEKCRKCRYNQTATCNRCDMYYDEFEPIEEPPMTNADKLRSMSDEELAEQLYLLRLDALRLEGFEGFIETKDEVLDWLREENE